MLITILINNQMHNITMKPTHLGKRFGDIQLKGRRSFLERKILASKQTTLCVYVVKLMQPTWIHFYHL